MAATAPKAGKGKTGGFGAFLKKSFHRSGKEGSKKVEKVTSIVSVDTQSEATAVTKKVSVKITSSAVDDHSTDHTKGLSIPKAPDQHSGKTRRLQAEKRLHDAATALERAMSKTGEKVQVPESIGLQHTDNVTDVTMTAKELETAIDGIIDARALRASADSRNVWKTCVGSWFKASYPYVKLCLKGVQVRN